MMTTTSRGVENVTTIEFKGSRISLSLCLYTVQCDPIPINSTVLALLLPGSTDSEAAVVDIAVVVAEERTPSAAAAYIPSVEGTEAETGTEVSTEVVVVAAGIQRGYFVFDSPLGLVGCRLLRALPVPVGVESLRGMLVEERRVREGTDVGEMLYLR